ncbi:MlaC/ttg2D family ABC transporter substrate-binding protein [Thalassospira lucentensis]|uniref:Organic solvent ABC transporter n=1 Tax=Thalassospira lucentensis TaxID=168935 RepID=A0A358HN04_9PROT|nr:ABC transporter substrate-binding protein [Thalassospira lucentensis]HBU96558.1 organic solvent ABC transporter [Thalassospira lucentensis]HCW65881.1 organic solvent ABC transporter [Thalassospira lucentensis]
MLKNKFAIPAAAVLALAAAWPLTVNAANNTSVEVVEIAAEQSASAVIQALADQALADLTDQTLSDDVRRKKFVALMDRYFEMDVVSRFVLGRYWRSISQEEISEFATLLQNYLALNYANQFKELNGEQFVVGNETQNNKDTFVNSQFVRPDGPPVSIVWRMREFDNEFKIIDVSIEGLSMGITQRDEFTSVIQQNGDDVSALTKALKAKTGL